MPKDLALTLFIAAIYVFIVYNSLCHYKELVKNKTTTKNLWTSCLQEGYVSPIFFIGDVTWILSWHRHTRVA